MALPHRNSPTVPLDEHATPRHRFIAALERRPLVGRVPHFELVFFLTMESFGKVHPSHRHYHQWLQMEESERQLHRLDMAGLYVETAERFEHSAIFLHPNPDSVEESLRLIDLIRERGGDRFFLMRHGDATFSIPDGNGMETFALRRAEDPGGLHEEARQRADRALADGERYAKHGGLDVDVICRWTPVEIRHYTRWKIEQCFADGFWALGTGNSLTDYIPSGNYRVVLKEGLVVS